MLPQVLFQRGRGDGAVPDAEPHGRAHDVRNAAARSVFKIRQINNLLIPSAVFMLVLTTPIVRLIFERGQFNATPRASSPKPLFWFAFSLPFRWAEPLLGPSSSPCGGHGYRRAWRELNIVSRTSSSRSVYTSRLIIGTVVANAVMTALQFHRLRIGFNGHLEGAQTTMITARILLASALLGAVSWVVWTVLNRIFGASPLGADRQRGQGRHGRAARVRARGAGDADSSRAHQVNRLIRTQLGRA